MNIRQLVQIIKITGKTIPVDIEQQLKEKYLSESKGEWIEIGDMDLFHLVRAFNKRHDKSTKKVKSYVENLLKTMEVPYEVR
jgi:predicted RNA-binding protein Jag